MDTITPSTNNIIDDQIAPTNTFVDAPTDTSVDTPTLKTSGRWEKPEVESDERDVENCPLVSKTVWMAWLYSLSKTPR